MQGFVLPPALHARKAQGDAGFMPFGGLDAFEGDLKDMVWGHLAHGAKALLGVFLHPGRDLAELSVRKAGVGFGEGDEVVAVPNGKGEIGKEVRAATGARLRIDHHRVDGQRIKLPFPPVAFLAASKIRAVGAFEHEPFGIGLAGRAA